MASTTAPAGNAGDAGFPVKLYVYDLTNGMAAAMSPMLLGQQIEGVWHTAVVVHGVEWFFGYGVQHVEPPGNTPFGTPKKMLDLGHTQVPKELVQEFVKDLGESRFKPEDYNLLLNNCNHFTDALANLLLGSGIPKDILDQHEVILRSPLGPMLEPILAQMEGQYSGATAEGFQ